MTRLLLIGLCLLASINSGNTQEVAFSQFMKNRLLLNPAYAGIEGGLSATVTRREQWGLIGNGSRLPGVFRTQAVTLEGLLGRELKSGWGLYYLDNTEGDANLRTINAGANYVYVLVLPAYSKLNRGAHTRNIRLGGGFYYATKRIDWNRLTFSDQIDPKGPDFFLPQSSQAAFFDDFDDNRPSWLGINFGFVFRQINYDINNNGFQWTLGGRINHLLDLGDPTSIESLQGIGTGLSPRWTFHNSFYVPKWQFGKKSSRFTPLFHSRLDFQSGISAFTLGAELLIKNIGFSVFYNNTLAGEAITQSTDALILAFDMAFSFGDDQKHLMEVGFSYDRNINGLNTLTGGVFELVVKYHISRVSNDVFCPPVSRAHAQRYERIFYKDQKNKNLD